MFWARLWLYFYQNIIFNDCIVTIYVKVAFLVSGAFETIFND